MCQDITFTYKTRGSSIRQQTNRKSNKFKLQIDANGHVKVSDFGLCQVKSNTPRNDTRKGARLYRFDLSCYFCLLFVNNEF